MKTTNAYASIKKPIPKQMLISKYLGTTFLTTSHSTQRSDENYRQREKGKGNSTVFKVSDCKVVEYLLPFLHLHTLGILYKVKYQEMKKALIFTRNQRGAEEETCKERERKMRDQILIASKHKSKRNSRGL